MKIIELNLNYDEIRKRIDIDKSQYKVKDWADLIGTSTNVISNIHGKAGKHNPSLQYVIAVARVTGKPVEWYLYGHSVRENQTYQIVAEQQVTYEPRWSPDFMALCEDLHFILTSSDEVTKEAIVSNLKAFKKSINKDRQIDEHGVQIKELMEDIKMLKKQTKHPVEGSVVTLKK